MANLSVEEPDALMRARPGLWEPWRATARATQPDADWRESAPCCRQTEARDAEEQKTRNRSLAIGPLIVYPDVAG